MPRGRSYSNDLRAYVYGLIQNDYPPKQIAQLVYDRFGQKISPKTIRNWKIDLKSQMEKYGVTQKDIKEAVARGLLGDQRKRKEILEDEKKGEDGEDGNGEGEPEGVERGKRLETPGGTEIPESIADMIGALEENGFYVAKNMNDLINIIEGKNLQVIRRDKNLVGVENIFVTPLELDVAEIGHNITANPIIQFYFALARREEEDLDISEWLTACVVDVYNRKNVKLAVVRG